MGFLFRKSFKIAPGVRLNLGKRGFSSISVGRRGARFNFGGKRGAKATLGGGLIPGLSYQMPIGSGKRSRNGKVGEPRLVVIHDTGERQGPVRRFISAVVGLAFMGFIVLVVVAVMTGGSTRQPEPSAPSRLPAAASPSAGTAVLPTPVVAAPRVSPPTVAPASARLSSSRDALSKASAELQTARSTTLTRLRATSAYKEAANDVIALEAQVRAARASGSDTLASTSKAWIEAKNKVNKMEAAALRADATSSTLEATVARLSAEVAKAQTAAR